MSYTKENKSIQTKKTKEEKKAKIVSAYSEHSYSHCMFCHTIQEKYKTINTMIKPLI